MRERGWQCWKTLKKCSGPFTNAEEVQIYLENPDPTDKEKQTRMKKEIKFARDSSTTLPRTDPLFKIQVQVVLNKNFARPIYDPII